MYKIEDSIGTYERIEIAGKPVYIFESHNMAFPAWGTVSSRNSQSYTLITFDYHTDTRPPFSRAKETGKYDFEWIQSLKIQRDDFSFQDAFCFALEMVAYDEQIKTACLYGYLNQYYVICSEDEEKCFKDGDCDTYEGYKAAYYNKDQLDVFLESFFPIADNERIIVDFDVDYFNSELELDSKFFEKIAPVLKKADAITIAKEMKQFEDLRESADFTHERAIDLLKKGLRLVLETEYERRAIKS